MSGTSEVPTAASAGLHDYSPLREAESRGLGFHVDEIAWPLPKRVRRANDIPEHAGTQAQSFYRGKPGPEEGMILLMSHFQKLVKQGPAQGS